MVFEVLAICKLSIFLRSFSGAKGNLKPTYTLIREREKGARRQNKKKSAGGYVYMSLPCWRRLRTSSQIKPQKLFLADSADAKVRSTASALLKLQQFDITVIDQVHIKEVGCVP